MKAIIILTISQLLIAASLMAQDTVYISKNEVLEKVAINNSQAKLADKDAELANADVQQSNSLFLPQVSASYTAMTTNNPLMAFGSRLNQAILTPEDFNPNLLNNPDNVQNFATEIMVLQPLLNLDGVHMRKAAKVKQEAMHLQAARTKEYLELEVSKTYMKLQLAYEAVAVLERAVKTSAEALSMVTDYYEEGMLQKADLLDVQVRASEVKNQLRYAKTNVRNVSDELAILMGEQSETVVYKPLEAASNEFNQAVFSESLSTSRKDILAMQKAVLGQEHMLKSTKMGLMPRLNAFGSFQMYDNQIMSFDASGYLIGMRLSWNIFDGYKTVAQTASARLQVEKARITHEAYVKEQQKELDKTNRMLVDAENKISLSQLAYENAAEAYRMRKDRFEQGLEKTADLLMAETQTFKKELEYKQAIFEYNFTKEYLHFLTR